METQNPRKRRKQQQREHDHRKNQQEPYPTHTRPTPQECKSVRDDLLSLHGFPSQFSKYQTQRQQQKTKQNNNDDDDDESVLDGLVKIVLSQNTTDLNSSKAFASLKSQFPTWDHVLAAEKKNIEDAIRCGGLAPTKASCIKNILSSLHAKRGTLCLEYLRDLSIDEVKAELSHFKGIGPKTVSCVLLFNLQLDDFPVDTHIFEIAKAIGWVPPEADRNKTYLHLNRRIPNALKFDLNCLLFTHGKLCRRCIKKSSKKSKNDSNEISCPLLNYCDKK